MAWYTNWATHPIALPISQHHRSHISTKVCLNSDVSCLWNHHVRRLRPQVIFRGKLTNSLLRTPDLPMKSPTLRVSRVFIRFPPRVFPGFSVGPSAPPSRTSAGPKWRRPRPGSTGPARARPRAGAGRWRPRCAANGRGWSPRPPRWRCATDGAVASNVPQWPGGPDFCFNSRIKWIYSGYHDAWIWIMKYE